MKQNPTIFLFEGDSLLGTSFRGWIPKKAFSNNDKVPRKGNTNSCPIHLNG